MQADDEDKFYLSLISAIPVVVSLFLLTLSVKIKSWKQGFFVGYFIYPANPT